MTLASSKVLETLARDLDAALMKARWHGASTDQIAAALEKVLVPLQPTRRAS